MKSPFDLAMEIVSREGGYVNDPDDPGGPTNLGVTLKTLQGIQPGATLADLKRLTAKEAAEIYVNHYLVRPKIDQLPESIQATVFDMNVNAGNWSIKILQKMLNAMGTMPPLSVDGALGPKTIEAAHKLWWPGMADAYSIERRNYYFDLADRRPASRKYARTTRKGKGGWITRAEEFMDPKYRMSDAEFAERTRKWA